MMLLYAIAYVVIGVVIARAWKTGWERRNEDALVPMFAAVGMVWPLMMVVVPLAFILTKIWFKGVAPAARWLFKYVDKGVERIVPEKAA